MSKNSRETYKNLTKRKKKLIHDTIVECNTAEPEVLYPVIWAKLESTYIAVGKEFALQKMDMCDKQAVKDTIESYVALYEHDLYNKGYLKSLKGRMITEAIKVKNKKINTMVE